MKNNNITKSNPPSKALKKEVKKEVKRIEKSGPRDASYGADMRALARFEAERARSASTPVAVVAGSGQRGKIKKSQAGRKVLKAPLADWSRLLADPFDSPFAKCPVNYNPVPTPRTTPLRLTSNSSVVVTNGQSCHMVLFPGHGGEWLPNSLSSSQAGAMDGVSYHGSQQMIDVTKYAVGPLFVNGVAPCIGYYVSGLVLGSVSNSNVAGANPISYDVDAPYAAVTTVKGHSRWKLVAMGIRIMNVTQRELRDGTIVVVQPSTKTAVGDQREYASDPTFRITRSADTSMLTVTWIPRPEDLAYWHIPGTGVNDSTGSGFLNGGIQIFFNADGGNPGVGFQTYNYELVTHWEIGGFLVNSISTPSIQQPADRSVVEPSIVHLRSSSGSASMMSEVAEKMAATVSPYAHSAVDSAVKWLTDSAASGAVTAAKHAAQFAATLL